MQLNPENFTRVFHDVQKAKTRFVVVYGGAASSKSWSVHQNELFNIMEDGEGDTLVVRKYGADLRESCFKLFKQLIEKYELDADFDKRFSNENRRITCKKTGRSLVFKGVDDTEKLKSIVGFKRIVVEETSQLALEDFMELNRRARGMEGIQLTLILNPVSENHWIKTQLCDTDGPYHDQTTVLRYTYHDNCNPSGKSFITEADIQELERLKKINDNHYRVYVLAEWGVENKEGKFCWAFEREQIVKTTYRPENVLWASFDFNVNPMTCTVAQIYKDVATVCAIECFKLNNSDVYQMCERLKSTYPDALWNVTGDATGNSRSAFSAGNVTGFQIIADQLSLASAQIRVPASNPSVDDNRIFVNAVHRNCEIHIDPHRCQPLIYDLTYVEVNGKGEILKDRSTQKKYADFMDNWRYLLNSAVSPWFII